MRTKVKGIITVEASILIPLVLLMLVVTVHILFYCHDKAVLLSMAHETLTMGCQREEQTEQQIEQYFVSRVKDRLLLLTQVEGESEIDEDRIVLTYCAKKGALIMKGSNEIKKTAPEQYIREVRKIIKMQEGVEEKE